MTGERLDGRNFRIRLNDPSVVETSHPLTVDGETYPAAYVVLGDPGIPHACVPIHGLADFDKDKLRLIGRKMRFHESFPKGANVNFFEIQDNGEILEYTYERGVEDFTYACGTGTGSVGASLAVSAARIRAGQEDAPALKAETAGCVKNGAAAEAGTAAEADAAQPTGNSVHSFVLITSKICICPAQPILWRSGK